jgi:2'-5' RNA ligase
VGYFYGVLLKDFELSLEPVINILPTIPVERGNHHITILYLGDKPPSRNAEDKVAQIIEGTQCFTVTLGDLTLLPAMLKPRVIAIQLINIERLARLRASILNVLRDLGVRVSDEYLSDFKPHITIAYIRSKVDPQYLMELRHELIKNEFRDKSLLINKVSLIRAQGNTYTEITTHKMQCPQQD